MFLHTHGSAQKKKKVEKVVAKLESDRLKLFVFVPSDYDMLAPSSNHFLMNMTQHQP